MGLHGRGGRVGRRSEAILLIKRWGIDPNKLAIKPDESLRTIALQPRSLRFRKCPCVLAKVAATVARCVCLCACVYTIIRTTLLFPVCRLAEVGDPEGGPKRGGAREARGGENKLISLTQPAVTPPQHDINPKPRLSLFKLYESSYAGESRELRGRLYPSLLILLLSLFRSYIPSLVGYKQEYTGREGMGKTLVSVSLRYFYSGIF